VRTCGEAFQDFLMAAMDAVKDPNRQPGVLQADFFQ
jgi:hypothetical protein